MMAARNDDGRPGLGEYDIAFATKDEEGAE